MPQGLLRQSTTVVLTALLILLGGCGSSSVTRFYILRSLNDAMNKNERQGPEKERCASIGIGPVRVADYLDRLQIVTRVTPNEVRVAEFDQWAEPLKQNIPRVLAENLSALLCTKVVVLFPWNASVPIDYQVEVEVNRLDGSLGGNSTLEAQWMAFDVRGSKRMQATKKLIFAEPVEGQDYQTLVSAHSRNLELLSRDIAAAIKTFP